MADSKPRQLRKRGLHVLLDSTGAPPPTPEQLLLKDPTLRPLLHFDRIYGLYTPGAVKSVTDGDPASGDDAVALTVGIWGDAVGCFGPVDELTGDLTDVNGDLGNIQGNLNKAWPGRSKKRVAKTGTVDPADREWNPSTVFARVVGDVTKIRGDIGQEDTVLANSPSLPLESLSIPLVGNVKIPIVIPGTEALAGYKGKNKPGRIYGNVGGISGDISELNGCVDNISGDVTNIFGNIAHPHFPWPSFFRDPDSPASFWSNPRNASSDEITHYSDSLPSTEIASKSPDFALVGNVSNIRGRIGTEFMSDAIDFVLGEANPDAFDELKCIWGNVSSLRGEVSNIRGNVSNIKGDCTKIKGNVTRIRGDVSRISGDVSLIYGDVTNLRGDVSKLKGEVSALTGDATEILMSNAGQVQGNIGEIPYADFLTSLLSGPAIPGTTPGGVSIPSFTPATRNGKTDASSIEPGANPWLTTPVPLEPPNVASIPFPGLTNFQHPSLTKLLAIKAKYLISAEGKNSELLSKGPVGTSPS
jgi:hypothetical protein